MLSIRCEVEFIHGPLDGYRRSVPSSQTPPWDIVVVPVNSHIIKSLGGKSLTARTTVQRSSLTSVALYEIEHHGRKVTCRFLGSAPPEKVQLSD